MVNSNGAVLKLDMLTFLSLCYVLSSYFNHIAKTNVHVDLILLYAVILLVWIIWRFCICTHNVCFHIAVFATCRRTRKAGTQKRHLELVTALALSQAICFNH